MTRTICGECGSSDGGDSGDGMIAIVQVADAGTQREAAVKTCDGRPAALSTGNPLAFSRFGVVFQGKKAGRNVCTRGNKQLLSALSWQKQDNKQTMRTKTLKRQSLTATGLGENEFRKLVNLLK